MIFNISDDQFKSIMQNPSLSLPVCWDGRDFENAIANLLDEYISEIRSFDENEEEQYYQSISVDVDEIEIISNLLKQCIHEYHQGFPATAFRTKKVMTSLMRTPLKVYQKSVALEPL